MSFSQTIYVFCSYDPSVRKDKSLFNRLNIHLTALIRQGVIKDVYDSGSGAGKDLGAYIETYINKAHIIVLLVSADFFASYRCYEVEMKRALELSEAGMACLIPVLLRPTEWEGSPLGQYSPLPPGGKPVSEWSSLDAALITVVSGIRKAIDDFVTRMGIRPSVAFSNSPLYNVPHRPNQFFTGRENELAALYAYFFPTGQLFQETRIQALSGMVGVGKTQLAVQYIRHYKRKYQFVVWLNASSRDVSAEIIALVDLLQLSGKERMDEPQRIHAIRHWLQHQDRWLLILDNLENFDLLKQLVPPQGGHVLLTTLSQTTGTLAHVVHIMPMEVEEGALFLLRRATVIGEQASLDEASEEDVALASSIAIKLGGLALALDQAGAYIDETKCDLARYLAVYEREHTKLLSRRGRFADDHPASVMVTLSLAFEKVAQECSDALQLLRLFAFLHPDAIPVEMIEQGNEVLDDPLRKLAVDRSIWDKAITTLLDYSLIYRCSRATMLSIHRIVQAILMDMLTLEQQQQWALQAVRLINSIFPEVEFSSWPMCERYLPQAQKCAELIADFHLTQDEVAHLLWYLGCYCYQRASYSMAEQYLTSALHLYEQFMEISYLDMAQVLNMLGLLYKKLGRYQQAEAFYLRALEIWERGEDHPDTATVLNNLALLYSEQGKYQEAETFYRRVLSIDADAPAATPLDTAATLNNIAMLLYKQGKYQEAAAYYQQALAIEESALSEYDPDLAISLNNLAALYEEQGDYRQARTFYRRALAIREQSLGREHPETAQSLNNLAGIYMIQKKYREAKEHYQHALEIYEKIFSSHHPEIAKVYTNLASLARNQKHYQQSERYYQQALAIYEQMLEAELPEIAKVLNGLGWLYLLQENNAASSLFLERALTIRTQVLGFEHPDTAETLRLQAELFVRQQRYEEAEHLFQQILVIYQRTPGQRSQDVALAREHYAQLLKYMGRTEEAAVHGRIARSLKARHAHAVRMIENDK